MFSGYHGVDKKDINSMLVDVPSYFAKKQGIWKYVDQYGKTAHLLTHYIEFDVGRFISIVGQVEEGVLKGRPIFECVMNFPIMNEQGIRIAEFTFKKPIDSNEQGKV